MKGARAGVVDAAKPCLGATMVTTVKKAAAKSGHANKPGTKRPVPSAAAPAHKLGAAAKAPGVTKSPVAKRPVAKPPVAKPPVAKPPVAKPAPGAKSSSAAKSSSSAKPAGAAKPAGSAKPAAPPGKAKPAPLKSSPPKPAAAKPEARPPAPKPPPAPKLAAEPAPPPKPPSAPKAAPVKIAAKSPPPRSPTAAVAEARTPVAPRPAPPSPMVQPPPHKPSLIKLSSLEPAAAARLTVVRNLIEAQGRHDLPAILACFGPEPTLEFVGGPRHIGAERVGQIYSDLLRAFPDLVIEVMAEHVADRSVVIEMVLQGNHRQQWLGMAPRGRPLSLPVCHVFLFDKRDQISALRIYLDRNLAIVQLTSGLLR
jgi:steroid delta-isomerase-like uncharacterized protein